MNKPDHVNAPEINKLRLSAEKLMKEISSGSYNDRQLASFWEIVWVAPRTLGVTRQFIADQTALSTTFFTSKTHGYRKIKLTSFFRVLNTLVQISNDILGDLIDDATQKSGYAGWIPNPLKEDNQLANEIQNLLTQVIEQLKRSNSLSSIEELDTYYRHSLIELLETTITLLKAPLIETELVGNTGNTLKKFAKKISEHGSSSFAQSLAENASKYLFDLLPK
ncbi:hypothetical protein [Terasakiella sp. SH-1]|uniref:hypothetical protein n=1 Tax=Terasakiella sp. SH-1 TaxID=2560057 RepID=UPI001073077F|nr:hypothetical protein [Terasakiella sp. SH-1]